MTKRNGHASPVRSQVSADDMTTEVQQKSGRKRILLFGYLPPPYFGPSVAYGALLRSEFCRHFDVTFINLSVVGDLRELEAFRPGKLLKLIKFFSLECWYLLTRRFDFCCYPPSFNRNAFLKDALLVGLARAFGVPIVLWAHGNNLPDFHARSPLWLQRIIDGTVGHAAAGIVLGERLRFNFQRQLPDEKIFSVPLGIEAPPSPPARAISQEGVRVLYLGNLIREKGVLVLLEAVSKVVAQRPDVRFRFTGRWWRDKEQREAERIIAETRIAPHVEFVGVVAGEAKWQLLLESDLLVFPTFYHYETFGLVLLEALWAGLPVVTTRRAAIPEIIQDGVNGLLVNEQDPADLAEKILRLVNDPALRQRMSAANGETFTQFYTHEQYGRRMIDVFEQLAARRAP